MTASEALIRSGYYERPILDFWFEQPEADSPDKDVNPLAERIRRYLLDYTQLVTFTPDHEATVWSVSKQGREVLEKVFCKISNICNLGYPYGKTR
ncbi:hypothetical protein A3C59_02120 [Candidatus Daviesbacteria bacterium RIFCSPHIGHO2_02_FULL_36_13]|uniref:Uncharacterized protein n=1 Tax=Candidatus Daviesbacteria bacterium RIFCSPHIGHO2_02_FULL_36_13 TaxID=1797768 RepID=A0A1F5JVC1_9BACT|nr:MAG: hypothetical protein A3C59_02120 [Candidatus Daviesbacteria bacterium RIFCSPHIGHO2_02_FULL_36_13]